MPPPRRPGAGFTLLELVIAMVIVVILAAAALPSMASLLARHRLRGTAGHLQADIALARQEANRRGLNVQISFQPGVDWCYALSTGPGVDCQQNGPAIGNGVIKRVTAAGQPGVRLLQASPMVLDARNGASLVDGEGARFVATADDALQIQVRLGRMGRAHVCAPARALAGVQACSL